jgi:TorA maturation chaperone TorD
MTAPPEEAPKGTIAHDYKLRLQVYLAFKELFEGPIPETEDTGLNEFFRIFEDYLAVHPNEIMKKGHDLVRSYFSKDRSAEEDPIWDEIEYDFNRLFVGPGRLLAAPFESVYANRGKDRVTMSEITESVREFYLSEKLEIKDLNTEPDDHIRFELEFIGYLLAKSTSTDPVKPWEAESYEKFLRFKKNHLLTWGFRFCQDIYRNANTDLYKGVGFLFYGFLEEEGKEVRREGEVFYGKYT